MATVLNGDRRQSAMGVIGTITLRGVEAKRLDNGDTRLEFNVYPVNGELIDKCIRDIADEAELNKCQVGELRESIETAIQFNALRAMIVRE